jgi:hypothetical protein
MKPLADRLRQAKATPEEVAFAADLIEGKFKAKRPPIRAYETFKRRAAAASMLAWRKRGETYEEAAERAAEALGRSSRFVSYAFRKYKEDPDCKAGKLVTPWPSEFFMSVLTADDQSIAEVCPSAVFHCKY